MPRCMVAARIGPWRTLTLRQGPSQYEKLPMGKQCTAPRVRLTQRNEVSKPLAVGIARSSARATPYNPLRNERLVLHVHSRCTMQREAVECKKHAASDRGVFCFVLCNISVQDRHLEVLFINLRIPYNLYTSFRYIETRNECSGGTMGHADQ